MNISAQLFLETLFAGKLPELFILIWRKVAPKQHLSHWFTDPTDAAKFIEDDPTELYYGVGASPENYGPKNRCKKIDIAGCGLVALDIDVAHADSRVHKKGDRLPPTQADAIELAKSMPVPPSALVSSGYGLHAYWLLDAFQVFNDDAARDDFAAMAMGWNRLGQRKATAMGWQMDSTFDLSRVLRVPGSVNAKIPEDPQTATVLKWHPERRYTPDEIKKHLPAAPELPKPKPKPAKAAPVQTCPTTAVEIIPRDRILPGSADFDIEKRRLEQVLTLDPDVLLDREKLSTLLEYDEAAARAWDNQQLPKKKNGPSEFDQRLANAAASFDWNDQAICDLMLAHRRVQGHEMKLDNANYYARTVLGAAIRNNVINLSTPLPEDKKETRTPEEALDAATCEPEPAPGDAQGEPEVKSIVESGPPEPEIECGGSGESASEGKQTGVDDNGGCDTFLGVFSARTGLAVTGLVRYDLENPVFYLQLKGGHDIRLGAISNVIYFGNFRKMVAAHTLFLMPDLKKGDWGKLGRGLLSRCKVIEVAPDATDAGAICVWLKDYLAGKPDDLTTQEAVDRGQPFIRKKRWHLFMGAFWNWCNRRKGCNLTKNEFMLVFRRSVGYSTSVKYKDEDGKWSNRGAWKVTKLKIQVNHK